MFYRIAVQVCIPKSWEERPAFMAAGCTKVILARTDRRLLDPGSASISGRVLLVWSCLAGLLVGEKVQLCPMMVLVR